MWWRGNKIDLKECQKTCLLLEKYCQLDTQAMIDVLVWLRGL